MPRRDIPEYKDPVTKGIKTGIKWMIILAGAFIIVHLVESFWTVIPAGHVGVMEVFGKVSPTIHSSGLVFPKNPFAKFTIFSTRLQKLSIIDLEASDIDGQIVKADIVIKFRIKDKQTARNIYETIGTPEEYVQILALEEDTLEGFKSVVTKYKALDILAKRDEVKENARKSIYDRLYTLDVLSIESVTVFDIRFTPKFDEAIERKKVAVQEALASEREVAVAEAEAKKLVAKAEGDKQVKILQAEAEAESKLVDAKAEAESLRLQREEITPLILQLREIERDKIIATKWTEAWNGQLPTIITGEGSVPFINIGGFGLPEGGTP